MSRNRATAKELFSRRQELLRGLSKGLSLQVLAEDLAKKYNCTSPTIESDWARRKQWLSRVAKLDDSSMLNVIVEGLRQIIPNAWYEYSTADNSNAKVGALRLAMDAYKELLDVLQSLGMQPQEPLKIEERIVMIQGKYCRIEADGTPVPCDGSKLES